MSLEHQPKALSAFRKISIPLSKGIGAEERCYKKENKGIIYLSAVFSVIHRGVELMFCDGQARGGLSSDSVQPSGSLAFSHLPCQQHSLIAIACLLSPPFQTPCPPRLYPNFHLCFLFRIIQLQSFRADLSDNIFFSWTPESLGKSPLKSPLLTRMAQLPHGRKGLNGQSSQ